MGKRLLLADDSITIQKVVEITFADKDYELDLAGNGDDALKSAQTTCPDLILADVFMPGLDGYQICERIKNNPDLTGVPVLLLAGTFEPFDEQRAEQVGAAGWISKPFTSQALIDKVEQTLAKTTEQEQQWQGKPSKSPSDSMLNAFEQVAATEFSSGQGGELSEEGSRSVPASTPESGSGEATEADPFASPLPQEESASGFATGGREDFSFEDLASADASSDSSQTLTQQEEDLTAEAPSESAVPTSEMPELNTLKTEEPLSVPPADFSFSSPEAEHPATSASGEESFADPFAAAEDSKAAFSDAEAELPSLDEFTAPPSEAGHAHEADYASQDVTSSSGAEVIDLQEEDIVAEGKYAATKPRVEARAAYLSDEELERIVERVAGSVIERLAAPLMEKVVWEVVPDLAESMIREEVEKIREHADAES